MPKINCAIYTRKSTEHGLDMEFNSLQNQEEACKAYILSQAFNGWEYYTTYADGGISGGTMERPGLQTLLNDIQAGQIQVVVVYKVDRLSRSIIDFHKMMQEFDKYGCNFVSITQSFDTSNSMGKLTLNMLLSFAQFEREVSAERVRDKIAASKAKGLWMGGTPPLGYDLKDKQLIPNPQEAELVNLIFTKYLELGNIQATADWMNPQGYRSKCWQTASGDKRGGHLFRYGSIQRILGNPVYIGKMPHLAANKVYIGKQAALVPCEIFEQVQSKIGNSKNGLREYRSYIRQKALLADKLFDDKGNPYKLTSTTKKGQKFQYYFVRNGIHIPVVQLDGFVLDTICRTDLSSLDLQTDSSQIGVNEAKTCLKRAVCIKTGTDCYLQLELDKNAFLDVCRKNPMQEQRQNDLLVPDIGKNTNTLRATFYIDNVSSTRLQNGTANNILTVRQLNESLVRGLARAWQCKKMIGSGMISREREKASGMNKRTFARYLNLCYLSPKIVTDILEYRNPRNMSLKELMNLAEGHMDFKAQEKCWESIIK